MKASNRQTLIPAVALCACLAILSGWAAAGTGSKNPPHQPVGTPHKASSLAPHHTGKKNFGAPIQAPILKHTAPPKKKPASG